MYKTLKKQNRIKLFLFFIDILILVAFSILLFEGENWFNNKIIFDESIFIAVTLLIIIINAIGNMATSSMFEKEARKNHLNISFMLGADINEAYQFAQLGLIYYDEKDKTILWTSELFEIRKIKLLGTNLFEFQPKLHDLFLTTDAKKEVEIEVQGRKFIATLLPELCVILLKDNTELSNLIEIRQEQAPVIANILIDNLNELRGITDDLIVTEIEQKTRKEINDWAKEYDLVIRKYKEDAYIAIFDEKTYQELLKDKFSLIDRVRTVSETNGNILTISIGIGRGSHDVKALAELANSSIDIALSRGGDQCVINNYSANMEFYGGKTFSKGKRSIVKSRVLSQSMISYINSCHNILIMGHKDADMDAIGACLGVYAIARRSQKDVNIIYDPNLVEAKAKGAISYSFNKYEVQDIFISPSSASEKIDANTLLFVVDCHSENMVMSKEVLAKAKNIAIIDHHRKLEDAIVEPGFIFQDPNASSTCELILELIKFGGINITIPEKIATIMLSGILLDTNNFRNRTGSRTYEACAVLKEYGAKSDEADTFLKDEYEEYLLKIKTMNNIVKNPYYGIVIVHANQDDIVDRSFLAKVADETMNLKEVKACFAIGRTTSKEVSISARSNGTINVQLIMEKMRGGGHFTAAATQIESASIDPIKDELLKVLRLFMNDAKHE